jgi:hypothetical protein
MIPVIRTLVFSQMMSASFLGASLGKKKKVITCH